MLNTKHIDFYCILESRIMWHKTNSTISRSFGIFEGRNVFLSLSSFSFPCILNFLITVSFHPGQFSQLYLYMPGIGIDIQTFRERTMTTIIVNKITPSLDHNHQWKSLDTASLNQPIQIKYDYPKCLIQSIYHIKSKCL